MEWNKKISPNLPKLVFQSVHKKYCESETSDKQFIKNAVNDEKKKMNKEKERYN